MFYVGIDIAKRKHEAVVTDDKGDIVVKAFSFTNDLTGYNYLLGKIKLVTISREQIVIGMESTSHYWLTLYTRLIKDGYNVHIFNPIQSDALRGMYIRQSKTDARDSFIIAEVIRFGKYSESNVPQEKLFALRELTRNRYFMVDSVSDLKRKTTALIDQVFPEYEKLFSNNFGVSSMALLLKYPTPEKLKNVSLQSLAKLLSKASNGYFGLGKAKEVKETAKSTFGVIDNCGIYATLISTYIKQILFIQEQVKEIDSQIAEIMSELDSKITTINGIGQALGAVIISEIGDISRFQNSDKLAAYAGVDPTVKQSGDYCAVRNHMSKRGSPYLRRAIWQASVIAVGCDPMFKAYYDKKAAEGKRYMNIIGHCTRKMISVIFAVLRDDKEYIPMAA